ncbi:MAG TPA: peptide deformylase [Candidatus Binataceae bacterium]|nr:peptide deformylase [Candidatus Binataceae bacterium]
MILKVARLGHPIVRTRAREVTHEEIAGAEFQALVDSMIETMREYNGVGLAATQIHLSLQLAVLEVNGNPRYPEAEAVPLTVLVNPRLTILDDSRIVGWEGCLSIPDLRGAVPRYKRVRVQALGRRGEELDFEASDFHARVIQHETDHLRGEVYLDRLPDMHSLSHLAEFQRFVVDARARQS